MTGLEPPWDVDPLALAAADILANVKARTGKFRELPEGKITCTCSLEPRTIASAYVGLDDGGVARVWLVVAGSKGAPPRCRPLPQEPGEPTGALIAVCPRCQSACVLMPADASGKVRLVRLGPPTRAATVD